MRISASELGLNFSMHEMNSSTEKDVATGQ